MTDQCQLCGCEVDEWQLVRIEMHPAETGHPYLDVCPDCDLERQGFFDDDDTVDEEERERIIEHMEKVELAASCTCGGWVLRDGKPLHCGDCVCGAQ